MNEEWRPIEGYRKYEVSNLGRVRSIDRITTTKKGKDILRRGKILKNILITMACGYQRYRVNLYDDNHKHKNAKVSILVAKAFIPNDDPNKKLVLHGPNGSLDNNVNNLYWGTQSQNIFDQVRDGTNVNKNKTHCPLGAPLEPGNLHLGELRKRRRHCLACSRATSWVYRNGGNYEEIHDLCFKYKTSPSELVKLGYLIK